MCSSIKVLIFMNKTLSGYLLEHKNKGKVQLGNPKSCQEYSLLQMYALVSLKICHDHKTECIKEG